MPDKESMPRFQLPAGTKTVTVCTALAALAVLGERWTILPSALTHQILGALLLLQPMAVHALLMQAEAAGGRGAGTRRGVLDALGTPLLIAAVPLALLATVAGAALSLTVVGGCLAYQLIALRSLAARHNLPVPVTPTANVPRLADGAQREGLLARAAGCGVTLAEIRVERGERVPEIVCVGGRRPVALVTEGALEQLDAPTREAMLVLEIMRRRYRRPVVTALVAIAPLAMLTWFDTVHFFASTLEVMVSLVPYVYLSALAARVLDALCLRAARRACRVEDLDRALQAARGPRRPWLWAGAFLDLWQGDALVMFVQSRSRLAAAALLVQAFGCVGVPLIALFLPWRIPDGDPRVALLAGAIAALVPYACSRGADAIGLRMPLDGVRMLVTAPPAWAAYLTLLGTAATFSSSLPEPQLLPLCFLATGMVLSWALLPGVRRILREDVDP